MERQELDQKIKKFQTHLLIDRGLRPLTRELYARIITRVLSDIDCLMPSKEEISEFVYSLYESGKSETHIRNIQLAVENYMGFLGIEVSYKRPKKKRRLVSGALSEAEVAVLIAAASNIREKAIVSLLASSGIRNRELCGLKVRNIDFGNNRVRIEEGKGGSSRACVISGSCVTVLLAYLQQYQREQDDFLFTTLRKNEPYTPWALRRLIKKLAKLANLDKRVHPHKLRHSLATNMLGRRANPKTVQMQLGHRHLSTTEIYMHSGYGWELEVAFCQPAYL